MSVVRAFASNRDSSGVRAFWIFDLEDNRAIEAWLKDTVGDSYLIFYGAFINWSMQHVNKARDPSSKYKDAEDGERTRSVVSILKTGYPADRKKFCEIMQVYYDRSYIQGKIPRGVVSRPTHQNMPSIRAGEKQLMEQVWNKKEREVLWRAVGNDPRLFDSQGKQRRFKKQKKRDERRALGGDKALGDWQEAQNAIEEAEEEVAVESTTAALEQTAIGTKQAWEEDLVDRTKA